MTQKGNYREQTQTEAPESILDPVEDEAPLEGSESRQWVVSATEHGQRLDKVLAQGVPEFSRSHLQWLCETQRVLVNGQPVTQPSKRVHGGQSLVVQLVPTAKTLAFLPQPIALNLLFEDEHLLVVNKPVGMVVHPAAGNWSGTLLNALLHRHPESVHLPRAGIVHRLDKDTSGVMVVGRSPMATQQLASDIAARRVHREYLALAHGVIARAQAVEAPIGRDPRVRTRMAVVASGKPARTWVTPVSSRHDVSAVRCVLDTGRTHQIRVHLRHVGHPLVGDLVYGGAAGLGMQRQALHAARLRLTHPVSGQELVFDAPPPEDFAAAWSQVAPEEPLAAGGRPSM